ncbi:MAG: hypothetical protein V2A56_00105 [bacterium]
MISIILVLFLIILILVFIWFNEWKEKNKLRDSLSACLMTLSENIDFTLEKIDDLSGIKIGTTRDIVVYEKKYSIDDINRIINTIGYYAYERNAIIDENKWNPREKGPEKIVLSRKGSRIKLYVPVQYDYENNYKFIELREVDGKIKRYRLDEQDFGDVYNLSKN